MAYNEQGLLAVFEFEKQIYMTKDEVLIDVENLVNGLMDTGQLGQVYNDGFKDGAKYSLQKLQQTPCNTLLLDKLQRMIKDIELAGKTYPRMWTGDVIRLLKKVQEIAQQ